MADLSTNLQRLDNNSDEILALTSDIADAIVAKGGTLPANAGLRSFADAIENIPSSPSSIKGVLIPYRFVDGTVDEASIV